MPRAPEFWHRPGPLPRLLAPAAAVYGWVAGARMERPPRHHPPVPVIAVGNFIAGGAGKTPTTLALARLLRAEGRVPAIVLRGYGGAVRDVHEVRPGDDPAHVGDEALEAVAAAIAVVAPDRARGVARAAALGADVVLFDDGFQNGRVARVASVVAVDAGYGVGNGRVHPAGPLRVPLVRQMARADLIVAIADPAGANRAADVLALAARHGVPVVLARLQPVGADRFRDRRVVGFAGIGRPDKFRDTLVAAGAEVVAFEAFADHHVLTSAEAARLIARAHASEARLVTTAKDMARLSSARDPAGKTLRGSAEVLSVDLVFEDVEPIRRLLLERLAGFQPR